MAKKTYLLIILFLLCFSGIKSQDIESWLETNEKVPVEKLYLHTDREIYFAGDTIWLKSYLTDSRSGRLIPGAENVYLHLIDSKGEIVLDKILICVNGQAPGHISLSPELETGNYLLRSYTDYLLNFGEQSYFYKRLHVAKPATSIQEIESKTLEEPEPPMVADVSFLPEGGKILEGMTNLVAFKAIDKNGFGINASGSVIDDSGNEVASFKTDYKGMGLFFFTPEPGKSYYAEVLGLPSFRFSFNSFIVAEGIKIHLVNQTTRELIVNISCNSGRFIGNTFYLVTMHRGEVVFYQPFTMEGLNQLLKFGTNMLKGGINQLILLDKSLNPISERLIFFNNSINVGMLSVNPGKEIFSRRSAVNLNVSGTWDTNESSNLSVAVVHEAALPEDGISQNILSYLLIDSELNGYIETPSDYFMDSEISAEAKQRLLMLTNGWSGYFWNSVPGAYETLVYPQKAGIDLHGVASDITTNQPLENHEVTLIIEKDADKAILNQLTGEKGRFAFTGLMFNDSANIKFQAGNDLDSLTTISLLPAEFEQVSRSILGSLSGRIEVPVELEKQKHNQDLAVGAYLRRQKTPSPVKVRRELKSLPQNDGHFRIYDRADQVIEIPKDETSYGNILDFLTGRVPGLDINADQIIIRGLSNFEGNSSPLFLVDGIPVITRSFSSLPEQVGINTDRETDERNSAIEKIKSIPIGDIDKVEILKSPQNMAVFGVEGNSGVIAVYTRKGQPQVAAPVTKNIIEQKIAGYSSYRKFYSPQYIPGKAASKRPDFRTTLFWDPETALKNGKVNLSFFTSSQTGRYRVMVEGISESGKICMGSAVFEVK
jgi:hypothetical protein